MKSRRNELNRIINNLSTKLPLQTKKQPSKRKDYTIIRQNNQNLNSNDNLAPAFSRKKFIHFPERNFLNKNNLNQTLVLNSKKKNNILQQFSKIEELNHTHEVGNGKFLKFK